MAIIIDGKQVAQKTREQLKKDVEQLKKEGIIPKLTVIMVGDNPASKVYVKQKSKACNDVGVEYEEYFLDTNTTQEKLLELIDKLNNDKSVNGILLQSPLPTHLDISEAFRRIDYRKDVDGFHPMNVGKLVLGQDTFISCTPFGIMRLFEEYKIDLCGKNVVIIGRSNIVGKPLVQCCLNNNATVTICHSKTKDVKEAAKNADVVVAAIGKAKFVKADMIKEGAIVIDVGINRLDTGKLVGDVDFDAVLQKASYITPVPGGVGPMTVAMLMNNVVKAAKQQNK